MNMKWHVPVSVTTLAMGIYLALAYMLPSFVPEYHDIIMNGSLHLVMPYAIFVLIGFPLFTLWFYTKLDTDLEFCDLYCESGDK